MKSVESESISIPNLSKGKLSSNSPVAMYLGVRLLVVILFLLTTLFVSTNGIFLVILAIIESFQFWFVKSISGLHLVGLNWYISEETFHYYSRPPPYIPISYQTNTFWFGFFFSVIFWLCSAIISLIVGKFIKSFGSFGVFAAELFNLIMFTKSHSQSKAATETDALAKLLDNPIACAQIDIAENEFDQKDDIFGENMEENEKEVQKRNEEEQEME